MGEKCVAERRAVFIEEQLSFSKELTAWGWLIVPVVSSD
jgi:hypothetical protein